MMSFVQKPYLYCPYAAFTCVVGIACVLFWTITYASLKDWDPTIPFNSFRCNTSGFRLQEHCERGNCVYRPTLYTSVFDTTVGDYVADGVVGIGGNPDGGFFFSTVEEAVSFGTELTNMSDSECIHAKGSNIISFRIYFIIESSTIPSHTCTKSF
eukprot:TRINITY_DN3535_c0_g1_i2.p1 TRINITY_DN3535_c0_g1~~TRINITY_DN3535_c0_g1_i2.p1  ORF type:complete len:155 (-),score=4.05 TRINITY_DN3535_c0_g1_i2:2-466(-)